MSIIPLLFIIFQCCDPFHTLALFKPTAIERIANSVYALINADICHYSELYPMISGYFYS